MRAALQRRPFASVLLWGPTGIGKTTLADSLMADHEPEHTVHVVGLAELSDVPLAAFAPVLDSLTNPGDDLGQRLGNVVGAIARRQPQLIVVDDAPLLDPISAAAVYQLARLHKLRCLLIARDEHPLDGPIQRLEHERVAQRITVGPLGQRDVESLLEGHLGDHIEPASVRSIHRLSGGNPLMLRGLALAAGEQQLVRPGRHGLIVEDPHLPPHLGAMMSARLARLAPEERSAATVLALAQPLPRRVSERDPQIGRLVARGLAVDDRTLDQTTLFHPLAAAVLLDELGDDRDAAVRRASSLLMEAGDEQLRFRALMTRLRHGVPVDAADLAWAAGFAHALEDHRLAIRLARAAQDAEASFDAALALGSALSALGEDGASQALRDAVECADADLARAVAASRLGQHLALRQGDAAAAILTTEAVLADLTDEDARALLESELLKWRSMDGAALSSVVAIPDTEGPARLGGLIAHAMVASMMGDAAGTEASIATARGLVDENRALVPFAPDLLDLNAFLVEVIRGRLREAEALARQRHDRARTDATGLWSYARALLALHTGRARAALALAERAVHELSWRDITGVRDAALALRATAEAQNGEDPASTLVLLDDTARRDVKVRLQCAEALAWHRLLASDGRGAAEIARAAMADGIDSHHLTLASLGAIVAIRAGHGDAVAPLLEGLAASTSSRLVAVLHRWSSAVDPEELAAVAAELEEVGFLAPAAESWMRAATETDHAESARAWQRAADACAEGEDLMLLVSAQAAVPLTEREVSVAVAAASRLRSHEIADDLGLSVRTVDNTLSRVYRKLGISSRLDLPAALDSLGIGLRGE